MNADSISTLFKSYRLMEIKCSIRAECSQNREVDAVEVERYLLYKKRLALVDHLMSLLTKKEMVVLRLHLIDGVSWNGIVALREKGKVQNLPLDKRSLQRTQGRALNKMLAFMESEFGASLDYLLESVNG